MSKSSNKDWIIRAPTQSKMERIEAFFLNHAYEPHRHDTFAIGQTLSGVQSFHYCGAMQHSLPNMTMVIHPDEKHDGESGSIDGFRYKMVYVEPALIQKILGGKPLPFIKNGISHDIRLFQAAKNLIQSEDLLEEEDALYDFAVVLNDVAGAKNQTNGSYDYLAAEQAREFIHASLDQNISLEDIEKNIGRDRWNLSRDFRLLFGTSPHQYLIMRRLDVVKSCLIFGESITQAAMIAGFYDQSHMTKHFTKTFGLTPARWKQIHSKKHLNRLLK